MITLLWPDGKITTGKNWDDLESAIRAEQWQPYKSRREFRQDMRHRATTWDGRPCKAGGFQSSQKFIQSLADHGLFMIMEEERNHEEAA